MNKLDEIRERYNHSMKFPRVQQFGHSTSLMDIGYLLSLLEVHPASEPPDTPRNVLVYELGEGWRSGFCNAAGNWFCAITYTRLTSVVCWQEQPVFPKKYVEGARK